MLAVCIPASAQRLEGELEVSVRDATGLPVPAEVRISNRVASFEARAQCGRDGQTALRRIPFGIYLVTVTHDGFQPRSARVEIESALPVQHSVTLDVAEIETTLTVREAAPLIDPHQVGTVFQISRIRLDENRFTTMGRSTINIVDSLPGWLLEANAVLHPRGSEYDTQYVIDGIPLYDNRSIGFAPAFDSEEFESVNVMTANLPAEFGRRLGGVIELNTLRNGRPGHHINFNIQGGSFDTTEGSFSDLYLHGRNSFSVAVRGGHTNRYLDPPSLANFTNKGTSAGVNTRFDRDLTGKDRLSLSFRSTRTNFLVPNDLVQQVAGQRQDRRSGESAGLIRYQHVFSSRWLGSASGMVRDTTALLWSNPLSTPLFVEQDRGFREGVVGGGATYQTERHTLKVGGDLRTSDIREQFLFAEPAQLPDIEFDFRERRRSTDAGLFIQDRIRLGRLTIHAGLRFDHHDLLIQDAAVSPRVGIAYYWEEADMLLRGSYDRVFQIPVLENLLLSSSDVTASLGGVEGALPLPASRANFYEIGLRKAFGNSLRLDAAHFLRDFDNYYDDDVLLNTGLSFPISFDSARIEGTEVRLELPRYKGLSSFVSYSNLHGTATSPVTGGLFVEGGEAVELRDIASQFPITQDQRNTVSAILRFEPHRRIWFSIGARYGSGLPVELEDDEDEGEEEETGEPEADPREAAEIPQAILDKVNFQRGRVLPNFSLDCSVGARIWQDGENSVQLQFDVVNATDRLNVINFTGLFSGTALAPGRMFGIKLRARF